MRRDLMLEAMAPIVRLYLPKARQCGKAADLHQDNIGTYSIAISGTPNPSTRTDLSPFLRQPNSSIRDGGTLLSS